MAPCMLRVPRISYAFAIQVMPALMPPAFLAPARREPRQEHASSSAIMGNAEPVCLMHTQLKLRQHPKLGQLLFAPLAIWIGRLSLENCPAALLLRWATHLPAHRQEHTLYRLVLRWQLAHGSRFPIRIHMVTSQFFLQGPQQPRKTRRFALSSKH